MAKYTATCHTKCYWLETIWDIGDVYEGDQQPPRHFNMEGEPIPEKPPMGPSEDSRSTKKLKEELSAFMEKVPATWNRKKIWARLEEFKIAESKDELTNPRFLAQCGFEAKSQAGLIAHQRQCESCKTE